MTDLKFKRISYKNKSYAIMNVKYKGNNLPVIMDWSDFNTVKKLKKSWKSNKYGFISCSHTFEDVTKDVFLHEIILAIKNKENGLETSEKPIVHINRIGLDNRQANLIYDTKGKTTNKNLKKKKRTIKLPVESGIKAEEIPTYVWYMKANGSHGERFMVSIGNLKWKTTSRKDVSLQLKLEEAKKYLRDLKKSSPEYFNEFSMNGDYTYEGKRLIDEYYSVIEKAGYDDIQRFIPKNNTKDYLRPASISRKEMDALRAQGDLTQSGGSKRRKSTLPKDCGICNDDIPRYCTFRPENGSRGSHFVIQGHPQQGGKRWVTTTSKKVSVKEKLRQAYIYLQKIV